MTYLRTYEKYNPTRKYNFLTKDQAFLLELQIYDRLRDKPCFPQLIDFDEHVPSITISNVGRHFGLVKSIKLTKQEVDLQIEYIVETLEENRIVHLDIHNTGKNLCYLDGMISLIDFDIAVIDDDPLTDILKVKYRRFHRQGGYESMKNKLKDIVYDKIYAGDIL